MPKKATVEGDVVIKNGSRLDLEPFTEEFILSDDVFVDSKDDIGTARIIIKKGLLRERLRKNYNNFKNERGSQVVSLEDTEDKAEANDLEALLIEATKLSCVPENIDNYRRPDYKAKALERAIEGAKKRQERKKAKKSNVQDLGYVD